MPTSVPPAQWIVLFIVHAADDQSRFYSEQLFTRLLQANSSPDVRVFVLRSTYDYADNTRTHAHLFEIVSEYGRPKIKRVYPDGFNPLDLSKDNLAKKSFGSMGENINLGDPSVLQIILNRVRDFVGTDDKGNYPKVMLFTWDHGCAFGIFDPIQYEIPTARPIKSFPGTDMLMIRELANAIKHSLVKVDILVMMNCWMQSIETNDQLKDCVEVLVAPETSIDWLGYDYISIINTLIDDSAKAKAITLNYF